MADNEMIIDVYADDDLRTKIRQLTSEYQVDISDFERISPPAAASPFPFLDPIALEAIQQATIVLALGTKALQFLSALKDVIDKSAGRATAIDRTTKKPIQPRQN
jgi:hypothetical protein